MSTFKVHNLEEGARPAPTGYSSWLDYWEKATGKKAGWCHRVNCPQLLAKATDGAHTAYEMSLCDWSSDVCSSDLERVPLLRLLIIISAVRPDYTSYQTSAIAGMRDRKSVV